METQVAPLSSIPAAVELLRRGEPVVFPTETVYGLGADVFNPVSIAKIFTIKRRPADNPLIAHIADPSEALVLADGIPQAFWRLAERFWPGPLAIVLRKRSDVPDIATAGLQTIGIRMPAHEGALELIRQFGKPLAAPSANLSGRPSPTKASDALEDLFGSVALILDGGECQIGIESTVVGLFGQRPVLLRPGAVDRQRIEEILQETLVLPSPGKAPAAPGMKYRHYAPKAKVRLVFARNGLRGPYILSPNPREGERLLSAKTLYASFREADRLGAAEIEVDCSDKILSDDALMNRLIKAAEEVEGYRGID